jgi:hypothetical protein
MLRTQCVLLLIAAVGLGTVSGRPNSRVCGAGKPAPYRWALPHGKAIEKAQADAVLGEPDVDIATAHCRVDGEPIAQKIEVVVDGRQIDVANHSAPPPQIAWDRERGRAVTTSSRVELIIETRPGLNARSLRNGLPPKKWTPL